MSTRYPLLFFHQLSGIYFQEKLAKGELEYEFWKKGMFFQDKKNVEPNYEFQLSKATVEGDKPLSKDWQYYKKVGILIFCTFI